MKLLQIICLLSLALSPLTQASVRLTQAKTEVQKEQVKAERPTLVGVIKSRSKKDDDNTYYYIELDDGKKIHISKGIENIDLKKHLNKRVEIKTRLRLKTKDNTTDFIKQIFEIKKVKKEEA